MNKDLPDPKHQSMISFVLFFYAYEDQKKKIFKDHLLKKIEQYEGKTTASQSED